MKFLRDIDSDLGGQKLALLTGLAVMCPDDPLQFLLDKLGYLKECGTGKLNWDLFVAEHMKPVRKIITESNLDFIFNMDDESFIPTPQMYAAAYEHYNKSLKSMCFRNGLITEKGVKPWLFRKYRKYTMLLLVIYTSQNGGRQRRLLSNKENILKYV
ncbi:hypothetical protein KUTeg_020160 [Tegillarca granosa]|uniref:Protein xylosyltransferase n=1 Tax=Tegillarca granosa TaxID=220873 RepID=A0ABQ9E705_TEGGR|nr:hypothetical protein KUTeg_020160 [Tegillarca granosa]